jgi:cytidylate kinase
VLRDDPRALRVRLTGPAERRVHQAMRLEAIDQTTAQPRQRQLDHTHATYAKHFYGVNIDDPSLYHVVVDSTTIAIHTCIDMLVTAARSIAAVADYHEEGRTT